MNLTDLSDQAFVEQFENLTLDPAYFGHRGHLRLACLYLQQSSEAEAIERISQGVQRYAASLGAHDKFHLTMTVALMRLISRRLQRQGGPDWQQFLAENSDLVETPMEVLGEYYTKEKLFSDTAKQSLVAPDIKPLGTHQEKGDI